MICPYLHIEKSLLQDSWYIISTKSFFFFPLIRMRSPSESDNNISQAVVQDNKALPTMQLEFYLPQYFPMVNDRHTKEASHVLSSGPES